MLWTVYDNEPDLFNQVAAFIASNEDLDRITENEESALRVTSNNGRFDVVRLLLDAGAHEYQLEWTQTVHKVVFGSLDDIRAAIFKYNNIDEPDFWSRTPLLIAILLGDIDKVSLLLELGANRHTVGRCGKTPLTYAIQKNNLPMLKWLIAQGFDIEQRDDFLYTPLISAAELGMPDCVQTLIDCGADIHKVNHVADSAMRVATNMAVVRLLVRYGEDINNISTEMRAELLGIECDGYPDVSKEVYLAGKYRRFGNCNAELTDNSFWLSMIKSGASAWRASEKYFDSGSVAGQPVWCYQRYGRSTTVMEDGRIIEIGGQHEDFYDPDFCIYNDVTVFGPDSSIRLYSYPKNDFPPTDSHTATLVGNFIYIIGNLGYTASRQPNHTPVYKLNIDTFEIKKVKTTGDMPGWISRHKATLIDKTIIIAGGKIIVDIDDKEDYIANTSRYRLDLKNFRWQCLD
ncbi:MAG: ankyrin repeat domain-containing protein [Pseudomonadota bacterium]